MRQRSLTMAEKIKNMSIPELRCRLKKYEDNAKRYLNQNSLKSTAIRAVVYKGSFLLIKAFRDDMYMQIVHAKETANLFFELAARLPDADFAYCEFMLQEIANVISALGMLANQGFLEKNQSYEFLQKLARHFFGLYHHKLQILQSLTGEEHQQLEKSLIASREGVYYGMERLRDKIIGLEAYDAFFRTESSLKNAEQLDAGLQTQMTATPVLQAQESATPAQSRFVATKEFVPATTITRAPGFFTHNPYGQVIYNDPLTEQHSSTPV